MLNFKIYDSLEITKKDGTFSTCKYNHIGENTVRTISMDSTDGFRGYEVVDRKSIQMPIGADVYGRLFNVIGDGWFR
jgi:F-type H+-transporting ATPase subunit beta